MAHAGRRNRIVASGLLDSGTCGPPSEASFYEQDRREAVSDLDRDVGSSDRNFLLL